MTVVGEEFLFVRRCRDVRVVTIDRPPANALTPRLVDALHETLLDLELDRGCRSIVITGGGRMFSAGFDLDVIADADAAALAQIEQSLDALVLTMLTLHRPIVGAINGHAVAAGLIIALACDLRIGSDDPACRMGANEVCFGVPFPTVSGQLLLSSMSTTRRRALLLEGPLLAPTASREIGFVDDLAAAHDVVASAIERAERLGALELDAFVLSKRLLRWRLLDDIARSRPTLDPELERYFAGPRAHAGLAAHRRRLRSRGG